MRMIGPNSMSTNEDCGTVTGFHLQKRVAGPLRYKQRGSSIIEVALMAPWIFFLFVGVFDFGFYAYAAICTQNAARAAALAGAVSPPGTMASQATVCPIVLNEMNSLPNTRTIAGCTGTLSQTQPVVVTITQPNGPDGDPASQVSVQYLTVPLIPIPGVLFGQISLTRTVTVRLYNAVPSS